MNESHNIYICDTCGERLRGPWGPCTACIAEEANGTTVGNEKVLELSKS